MAKSNQEALLNAYLRDYARAQANAVAKGNSAVRESAAAGVESMTHAPLTLPEAQDMLPDLLNAVVDEIVSARKTAEKQAVRISKTAKPSDSKGEVRKQRDLEKQESSTVSIDRLLQKKNPQEQVLKKEQKQVQKIPVLRKQPDIKDPDWIKKLNQENEARAERMSLSDYMQKDDLTNVEKRALWKKVNAAKEENRKAYEAAKKEKQIGGTWRWSQSDWNSTAVPEFSEKEMQDARELLALEKKLGPGFSAGQRLNRAIGSMLGVAAATPGVMVEHGKTALKERSQNQNNPEYVELQEQIADLAQRQSTLEQANMVYAPTADGSLEYTPEYAEVLGQRKDLEDKLDSVAANLQANLDTPSGKILGEAMRQQQEGRMGLSDAQKKGYDVLYSVADNAASLPVAMISPGAALGMMGAKSAAQGMYQHTAEGENAGRALGRGLVEGGIEVATEKIGMDNMLSVLGKGGESALRRTLGEGLKHLANNGGNTALKDLISNTTAEGLEEVVGYFANYAADKAFQDPTAKFSLPELWDGFVQGAAAGGIMGAGGVAANYIRDNHIPSLKPTQQAPAELVATEIPTIQDEKQAAVESIVSEPQPAVDQPKPPAIEERPEQNLLDEVSAMFSVPQETVEGLRPLAAKLMETISKTGKVDNNQAYELFKQAYDLGVVHDTEMYDAYWDVMNELQERLDSAPTVESAAEMYPEFAARFPNLFPVEIQYPEEQVLRMRQAVEEITPKDIPLKDYWGKDAENMQQLALLDYADMVDRMAAQQPIKYQKTRQITKQERAQAERKIANEIKNIFSLSPRAQSEMRPLIQQLSNSIVENGVADPALIEQISDAAYGKGTVTVDDAADDAAYIRDLLKGVRVSPGQLAGTTELRDLRSKYGRRNLIQLADDGTSVDRVYQELTEQMPGLFPSEVFNEADKLARMYEVASSAAQKAKVGKVSLDEYSGRNKNAFLKSVRGDIDAAVQSFSDALQPRGIGAKAAEFPVREVVNKDYANQRRIKKDLTPAQLQGIQVQHTHIVRPNAQVQQLAQQDLDLAVQQTGGDVDRALTKEMHRLNSVEQWNDENQKAAMEIQDYLKQKFQALEGKEKTDEYALAKSRFDAWSGDISRHRTSIAQSLQAGRSAPLTMNNITQKAQQWKHEKGKAWSKQNPKDARNLNTLAKEIKDAQLPKPTSEDYQQELLKFGRERVKELANQSNLDLSDEQTSQLAADMVLGHSQEAIFDHLVDFKAGLGSLSADAVLNIQKILAAAENLPENSKDRMDLETQVYAIMTQELSPKSTWLEKFNTYRYLAMLGNARTHVRNILGNVGMDALARTKDLVGTVLENAIVSDKSARTKSILGNSDSDRALRGAAFKDAESTMYRKLTGDSRFNVKKGIDSQKQVFGLKPLESLRKANDAMLEGEDVLGGAGLWSGLAGSKSAVGEFAQKRIDLFREKGAEGKTVLGGLQNVYAHNLAMILKARGYDASIFQATDAKSRAVLDDARLLALEEAQKNTFHEDSQAAADLTNIKSKPMKVMFEALLPFKKTPINVAKQGVRYSPVGAVDAFTRGVYQLKKGKITTSQFLDKVAAGLTGSGIMALGYFLAKAGFLRGSSEEEERQFNAMQGKQDYALDFGKYGTYTIDWLSPAAMPLLVGAEINKIAENKGFNEGQVMDALSNIGEPVLQTTMLQGLNDTLEAVRYAEGRAGSAVLRQMGTGLANQFVPTAIGQIARSIDPLRRSNYGGGQSKSERDLNYALQKTKNKIPLLSMSSEPYIDAWGREQKGTGLIANTLSPGFYSPNRTTETEEQLEDLYKSTGNTATLPTLAPKKVKVDQKDYYFTPEEYTEFARNRGQTSKDFVDEALSNSAFQALSKDQQADIIPSLYNLSTHIAASEVLPEYSSESSEFKAWKKIGSENIIPYLVAEEAIKGNPSNDGSMSGNELYENIYSVPNLNNEQRAQTYFAKRGTDTKAKQVYDDLGADGLEVYLALRSNATPDGGTPTKNAIVTLLDSLDISDQEKAYWFDTFGGNRWKNNPYL